MYEMGMDRRRFGKIASMAASAIALRRSVFADEIAGMEAHIDIMPDEPIATIAPEIYSHFIEQLGRRRLRRCLGWRRFEDPESAWNPEGLHRHYAGG